MLDARGRPLFANASGGEWALDTRYALPPAAGGLVVHARIRPALADALVIGGLPRSRLPFLLGLLVLATGLSVVAVMQLRREGELARLRADFVSSVSHELRTPLAQIRLYLETLRLGRWGTEAQREHALVVVDRETRRLAHLVENVLQFSRASRGDRGPRQRTDVAGELACVAEEFAPLAASRGARIAVTLGDPPPVAMRAGALRQVLLNLLDNAVKYGPAGQTIRLHAAGTPDGRAVVLTVDDEGRGVAPGERESVWRPFHRGAAASELGAGGSGIGLAVVREIVVGHGGRTRIDAAPGGGARVVVELPAMPAAPAAGPPAATPGASALTRA